MEAKSFANDRPSTALLDSPLLVSFFLLVLASSLCGNVVQGWRLRSVPGPRQKTLTRSLERRTGQAVTKLEVKSVLGQSMQLDLTNQETVLYIFDPSCHWCARNLANIDALATASKGRYRIIGLSRTSTGLQDYLNTIKLPFPVYVNLLPDDSKRLDYQGTPQTVVLGADGIVRHNWPGVYSGPMQKAVEQYFSVSLPGLLPS